MSDLNHSDHSVSTQARWVSGWYAASQGVSAGFEMAGSLMSLSVASRVAAPLGACACVVTSFVAYYFQGEIIRNGHDGLHAHGHDAPIQRWQQAGCMLLDLIQHAAARYFLWVALCGALSLAPTGPLFWCTLMVDVLIKQCFAWTNESYEAIEHGLKQRPWYADRLQQSPAWLRRGMRVCGSLEHVICDDILPGVLILFEVAMPFLMSHPLLGLGLLGGLVAFAGLTFSLTYFFEGGYTARHMGRTQDDRSACEPNNAWWVRAWIASMWVMAPLHGVASAFAVWTFLSTLWPAGTVCVITASVITFVGSCWGACSEVRDAQATMRRHYGLTSSSGA